MEDAQASSVQNQEEVMLVSTERREQTASTCILQVISVISLFIVSFFVLSAFKLNMAPWDIHWFSNPTLNGNVLNIAKALNVELSLLLVVTLCCIFLVLRSHARAKKSDTENGFYADGSGAFPIVDSLDTIKEETSIKVSSSLSHNFEGEKSATDPARNTGSNGVGSRNAEAQLNIATAELDRVRKELSICREELEEANVAKAEFLSNMSHELLTPMNGIQGMTDLLLAGNLPAKERRFVNSIVGSSNALLDIINDLLDFSKIESGSLKLEHATFSMRDCVEDVCSSKAAIAHGKDIELICYIDENVPEKMDGDPNRVRQILNNLISNAISFTNKGEVVVRLCRDEDATGTATYKCDVQDTGEGISPEMQARLFGIFTQADTSRTRAHGGLGMGLAITKELVSMMGGEMSFRSRLGEGTRFSFTIQLEDLPDAENVTARRRTLNGAHVLVVDDSDTNRTILFHQLTSWGLVVDTAESGEDALQTLKEAQLNGNGFDAIVLDNKMPGMSGLDFARSVQQDNDLKHIKSLLLSSTEVKLDCDELQKLGIYKHVSKPVRQSVLHDSLVSVMPNGSASPVEMQTKKPKPKNAHVLLVEDNVVNRDVATGMLEQLGCDVTIAQDGDIAVKLGEAEKYDMVLMDCQMPMMDGYEATRRIKNDGSLNAPTPIVALTANATSGDREKCLSAGMDDYVSKPVRTQILSHMIDKWVAHPINKLDPEALELDPPMLFTGVRDNDLQTTDVPGQISVKPAPAITAQEMEAAAASDVASADEAAGPDESTEPQEDRLLVNVEAINAIRAMQKPGKDDILKKVVTGFVTRSSDLIDQLLSAANDGSTEDVLNGTKSLKSSSAYLGAETLADLCEQIELAVKDNQPSDVTAKAQALKAEYGKVTAELTSLIEAA